jgi:PKD repeat protein
VGKEIPMKILTQNKKTQTILAKENYLVHRGTCGDGRRINMKKFIITYIFIFGLVFSGSLFAINVSPSGTHYVGDLLTFTPTSASFGNVTAANWDFGDGGTTSTTYGPDAVIHTYKSPGIYTVSVEGVIFNNPNINETITLIIEPKPDNRSMQITPLPVTAGQEATFTAVGFYTPDNIRWDMGDGTILRTGSAVSAHSRHNRNVFNKRTFQSGISNRNRLNRSSLNRRNRINRFSVPMGTSTVTHTYGSPGTYIVRAYDFNGQSTLPVTMTVTVALPPRSITFTPAQLLAGAPVTFTANNFLSSIVNWNFGDGTVVNSGSPSQTHVYNSAGSYTVTAVETDSQFPLVSITVRVVLPPRVISFSPQAVRVDQLVTFQATGFLTNSIDWNFGDSSTQSGGSTLVAHRYSSKGTYMVSAKDSTIDHPLISTTITILEENRYIIASPPEVRTNEDVTVTAFNFRGDLVLWNFGDGTQSTGNHTETHQYQRAGTYNITARDESGQSEVVFRTQVVVKGIDDQILLEIAEVRFQNGKYYKVVPKNSKNIRALLRMKMRGTGIVSGYWAVDGHPFEYFNEIVSQGEVRNIYTRLNPGLPTLIPGLHTITLQLTRPNEIPVSFPILKYFVLNNETTMETLTPVDGFIAKENEIPEFSWKEPKGASKYQIAFSNDLYPMLSSSFGLKWIDVGARLAYVPSVQTWNRIRRNRWAYWRVRAVDTNGNIIAESDIMDIKVVIATAKIKIDKVTDLHGKPLLIINDSSINATSDDLLVHGSVQYMGASTFLVLRVFVDNTMTDQLLFRDVKKKEIRYFETSIPNTKKQSQIRFQVLKTSSPAVIVGIKGLMLKR